jgi:two-component system, sensor histidine kinase LadS
MLISFKQIDFTELTGFFSNEDDCLKFIAEKKWESGFVCLKCGHTNYCKGKSSYSRRCTRCKTDESVTAHTIFHRCHIPITEAFRIVYLVCRDPEVSTHELSRLLDLRQMTCWKLKSRLMDCIKNRGEIDIMFHEKKEISRNEGLQEI